MKRIFSGFLAMVLLLSAIPILPAAAAEDVPAVAASQEEIQMVLTEAFNGLKARLNPGDGTYDGAFQLLSHALFEHGKDLIMDEDDPFTGLVFNTNLMERAFVPVLTRIFQQMMGSGKTRQIGFMNTDWYDNNSGWSGYLWKGDSIPELDVSNGTDYPPELYGMPSQIVPWQAFGGPYNDYDAAMVLLGGAVATWFSIEQVENKAGALTYHVQVQLRDLFDFNRDYDNVKADATLAKALTWFGKLLEMGAIVKSFAFFVNLEFDVTFSNDCTHQTDTYRWEFSGSEVSTVTEPGYGVNHATKAVHTYTSSTTGEEISRDYYPLEWQIPLRHDVPWTIEYRAKGTGIYFGSEMATANDCKSPYLCHSSIVYGGDGERVKNPDETSEIEYKYNWNYYGLKLSEYKIKTNVMHTFRLQNVVNSDGSNMVYLMVDGETIAPMNHYYFRDATVETPVTEDMGRTVDWFNGKDLAVSYIFNRSYPVVSGMEIEYVQIWENGIESPNKSLYYTQTKAPTCTGKGYTAHICAECGDTWADNYVDARGHSYGACSPKDGSLHTRTCSVCGEEVADAHNWSGGSCTDCGYARNARLAGSWETDFVLAAADLGVNAPDARLRCTLTFDAAGGVSASWKAVDLTAFRELYHGLFVNAYYAMAYGSGVTSIEETERICMALNGMSVSDYIYAFLDGFDIDALFTPGPTSGTYRISDDDTALYTDLELMGNPSDPAIANPFTLEGSTLKLGAKSYNQPAYTFVCTKK